jgi:hypothetical protein
MKTKKEIIREYKDRRKPAGIFQIKNVSTGKVFLGSSLDLDGVLNSHRFRLEAGLHPNESLQQEWNEKGPREFEFTILETVPATDDPQVRSEDELTLLEGIWLEKLEADRVARYNTDTDLRRP